MTTDDYLVAGIKWCGLRCNLSCLYRSTDNGLFFAFNDHQSAIIWSASICLPICMFCSCVCIRVKLEIHNPGNTNKLITDVLALTTFYFTVTLYDRKICLLSLHQAYGSVEINKQNHSRNRLAKGFQLRGLFGH